MSSPTVRIVIDSTADLPADLQDTWHISVIPLHVRFGNESFRDGVDMTRDQFYERLAHAKELPTTASPSIGEFVELYEQLAQETDAILSIHLSGKMSRTVESARQAARMISAARVEVIDSENMSMIIGYMATAAAAAARAGAGLDEVVRLAQDVASRAFTYVGFESLHHLERGGRIGHARAFLGTLLQIKPLTEIRDGELHPLERVRTTKRMQARLVELTQAQAPLEHLAVLCAARCAAAEKMCDQIARQGSIERERMHLVQVGSTIGTHVGPDSLGVAGVRRAG